MLINRQHGSKDHVDVEEGMQEKEIVVLLKPNELVLDAKLTEISCDLEVAGDTSNRYGFDGFFFSVLIFFIFL